MDCCQYIFNNEKYLYIANIHTHWLLHWNGCLEITLLLLPSVADKKWDWPVLLGCFHLIIFFFGYFWHVTRSCYWPIFFTPMNPHSVYQSVYSVKKQHASVFTVCIELQPWNEQSWSNKMKFNGKYKICKLCFKLNVWNAFYYEIIEK